MRCLHCGSIILDTEPRAVMGDRIVVVCAADDCGQHAILPLVRERSWQPRRKTYPGLRLAS